MVNTSSFLKNQLYLYDLVLKRYLGLTLQRSFFRFNFCFNTFNFNAYFNFKIYFQFENSW